MSHSTTKVQLGATSTNFKIVENHAGSIAAGKICRLKSDDTITTAAADGNILGVSLGTSLSDTAVTAIVKKGTRVPVCLTAAFQPAIGGSLCVDDVTGLAKATGGGVTTTNGIFVTGRLTSISESGTETANDVALVDMAGGL
jgi:hypothetical protein